VCTIRTVRGIVTIVMFINFFAKINVGTTICVFNVVSMLVSAVTLTSKVRAFTTLLLSITGL
jgi:hypothetical protein